MALPCRQCMPQASSFERASSQQSRADSITQTSRSLHQEPIGAYQYAWRGKSLSLLLSIPDTNCERGTAFQGLSHPYTASPQIETESNNDLRRRPLLPRRLPRQRSNAHDRPLPLSRDQRERQQRSFAHQQRAESGCCACESAVMKGHIVRKIERENTRWPTVIISRSHGVMATVRGRRLVRY